jgi:dienelactone hydrolase
MRTTLPSGTPVEVARPSDPTTPSRGLVIAPDIMGLRPLFEEMAARLAEENGWAVAAVEPFPGGEDMPLDKRMVAVGELHDTEKLADLVAAADLLAVESVGIIGFCMGGMLTIKAASTLRFDRAAAFYGMIRNPEAWHSDTNQDAIDLLKSTPGAAGRVLAIIGTADPYTPADHVEELEAAGATVVRYEGAEHGFVHDPSRPAHRAEDAADAWRRVINWLSGRGSPSADGS